MPESYTGNEGTDALAAGYDILDGTEDRRDGWLAINKTRDYLAALKTWTQAQIAAIVLTWDAITGKPTLFPSRSDMVTRSVGGNVETALNDTYALAQSKIGATGGTITGTLYVQNATPASSSYTVCYLNGDGRVSKGASSERYKRDIADIDPADLGDIWPQLTTYIIRDDETNTPRVGYIAERLHEHPDQALFVVYDDQDRPDSIDFIALLMAQNAQLHQRVLQLERDHEVLAIGLDLLAQRLSALEA